MSIIARVKQRQDMIALRAFIAMVEQFKICYDMFGMVEQSHDAYATFGSKYNIVDYKYNSTNQQFACLGQQQKKNCFNEYPEVNNAYLY